MRRLLIERGLRFGHLTVICQAEPRVRSNGDGTKRDSCVLCLCDCGRVGRHISSCLKSGLIKTCGTCYKYSYVRPDAAVRRFYRTYRRNAKSRGLVFELSKETFIALVTKRCTYCGQFPKLNSYSKDVKTKIALNGIDRKNASIGYTKENVVSCCSTCNSAKSTMSVEDFLSWIRKVYAWNEKEDE